VLDEGVEVHPPSVLEQPVVDWVETGLVHEGRAEIDHAGPLVDGDQQVGLGFEVAVADAARVDRAQHGQQLVEPARAVGPRRLAVRRARDVLEHQVAASGQTMAARHAGDALQAPVGLVLAQQRTLAQCADRPPPHRRLHHQVPAPLPAAQQGALVADREDVLAPRQAGLDPLQERRLLNPILHGRDDTPAAALIC
jgi:hypothetical protein